MGPESVVKFYWYVVECLRTYQEPRRSFKCMPYAESNMHPPCTLPASHYKKRCPSLFVQPCLYNMFILIQLVFPSLHNQYRSITCFAYSEIYYAISQHCHFDLHHTPSYVHTKRYPVSRKIINAIRSSSTIYHCQRPSQLSTLSRISPFTLIIAPYSQHPLGFLRPSSSTSPEFRIYFLQDFSLRLHSSNVGACA